MAGSNAFFSAIPRQVSFKPGLCLEQLSIQTMNLILVIFSLQMENSFICYTLMRRVRIHINRQDNNKKTTEI